MLRLCSNSNGNTHDNGYGAVKVELRTRTLSAQRRSSYNDRRHVTSHSAASQISQSVTIRGINVLSLTVLYILVSEYIPTLFVLKILSLVSNNESFRTQQSFNIASRSKVGLSDFYARKQLLLQRFLGITIFCPSVCP